MAPNSNQKLSTILAYENEDIASVKLFEQRGYRTSPILFVNGSRIPEDLACQARPNQTLLSFLRSVMRLTGSKLGCAEGGCGACTVMISKKEKETDSLKHFAVNACLMPVLAADGCHVTTVEGIGTVKGSEHDHKHLHPVQKAMVDMHGSQCGFCTPGIIVSIYTLLSNSPSVSHLEEHLDGNLCRCTGYRPIWDAARSLCDDATDLVRGPCGSPCRECPEQDNCRQDCNRQVQEAANVVTSSSKDKMQSYQDTFLANQSWRDQPNQMFPNELIDDASLINVQLAKPLMVVDQSKREVGGTWFKPTTFSELLTLLKTFGNEDDPGACKIVVGNTEVGIETKFKHVVYRRLICPSDAINELFGLSVDDSKLVIGSCCPLSIIQDKLRALGGKDSNVTRTFAPMHDMLRWFASTQIRNVACLGGNIVTASPISDMNPLLLCMGASLILTSMGDDNSVRRRSVNMSDFFLRYRVVDLKPTEVLERIEVPILKNVFEYFHAFKQARRREDDISIVTSGMRLRLIVQDDKYVIDDIALAFGGMAIKAILAVKTMKAMVGSEFCSSTFERGIDCLLQELKLPEAVPGGQAVYRMTLSVSFLYKFFLSCVDDLKADIAAGKANPGAFSGLYPALPPHPSISDKETSGAFNFLCEKKPSYSGVQQYGAPKVAKGIEEETLPSVKEFPKPEASTVGKAVSHTSAALHCTGEAVYADDIPPPPGTLHAALILSDHCGSILEDIDVAPALALPAVHGVYTHVDIVNLGGRNEFGAIVPDEFFFLPVGERVRTVCQVLGVVVADSVEAAELGARLVKVRYGHCNEPLVVSIEDAIQNHSFYEDTRHGLHRGDLSILDALATTAETKGSPKVGDVVKVSGIFKSGSQEHFYLETGSSLVVPSDSDTNLTIYCSTQAAMKTQMCCAAVTGTPAAKVVTRIKRLGGGFGGKETRTVFATCAAAVAAKITCRPVRLNLSRDVDMKTTGTRHAFIAMYSASAKITEKEAKLVALDVKLYSNGGWAHDLSGPVMDRALLHVDNVYNFPNFRCEGVVCQTVQPNHTAFRGFGAPQGMAVTEHIVEHLAVACGVSFDSMRRDNLYKDGDRLPLGMIVGEQYSGKWNVPHMFDRLYKELDVAHRRAQIDEFNAKNKWMKRGLAFIPTKFGCAFTAKHMNQGGALVHLYTDGTVLVSHGGTEMGQGLHTKCCMVAAQAFGIPLKDVYVNDSSTDKVANSIPTAASMSTDLYGMATLDACRQILRRLEPIREHLGPGASLKQIATSAHLARLDLSAHGFYIVKDERCGYDWLAMKPDGYPADKPENSWKGHPFNYYTQGVACSEVEVDFLSGNHRTLRCDVLVDVGSSINPMIDIGQIEGAFTQGMGWSTMEEVIYSDNDHTWIRPPGSVFTTGPGTYKIPAFNDAPEIFNVAILENAENPFAVHSSKAVGEPPLFLGTSVYFAIRDAVRAARKEHLGKEDFFSMHLPATSERIRMHAADFLASRAATKVTGTECRIEDFQPQGSF